ncbi:hypothetical protein [Rhodococcus koreensis]
MTERIEQFPEDDWVDQDLLTKELAGSLLDDEIASERARIAMYDRGEVPADAISGRSEMQRRLDVMLTVRDGLRARRSSS